MVTKPLNPLRTYAVALAIFAGMASAHAQLKITFIEDQANGHLSILFSGTETAPFAVTEAITSNTVGFRTSYAFAVEGATGRGFQTIVGWTSSDQLPLTAYYNSPIHTSGTGGFYRTSSILNIVTTTPALAGQQIIWDGIITYVGDLAGIGLEEGDFGTLTFTNGTDTLLIDWDTAVIVPESATYALALGLGVAGIALLRRRSRA